MNNYKTKSAI